MLGLSFASVPLYDLFCRVTGYAGTVQRASLAPGSNGQYRNIQIRFDSNISQELNWEFKAPKKEIIVQPGYNKSFTIQQKFIEQTNNRYSSI